MLGIMLSECSPTELFPQLESMLLTTSGNKVWDFCSHFEGIYLLIFLLRQSLTI
jgi:hypothetical protein